jgi:hypothetical protein
MNRLDPEAPHLRRREVDRHIVLLGAKDGLARIRDLHGQAVEGGGARGAGEAENGKSGKSGENHANHRVCCRG